MVTGATFLYFMAMGALIPTLPKYVEDELGGGGVAVGIVLGSFAVSAALARPWAGRLGDLRGRRLLVTGGAGIFGLSLCAYALVDSLVPLIALRLLSGLGEAAMFVGAATAIQDLAPDDRRGEAASYFSVALYAGLALGPAIGEQLADAHGFHTLWVAAGLCSLAAAGLGLGTPARANVGRGQAGAAAAPGRPRVPASCSCSASSRSPATRPSSRSTARTSASHDVGPVFFGYAGAVLLIRMLGARLPDRLGWRVASSIALVSLVVAALLTAAWASSAAVWIAAGVLRGRHVAAVPGAVLGGGGRRARGPAQPGRRHVLALLRPGQRPRRSVPRPRRGAVARTAARSSRRR